MRIYLLLLCFFGLTTTVLAQPTKAEIDRLTKQAQDLAKKYGQDSITKKYIKAATDQQKTSAGNNSSQGYSSNYSSYASDPGSAGNVDNWRFPARNPALLASLPKKVLSRSELANYLGALYKLLQQKFPAEISSSVASIGSRLNNDGGSMGDAAVSGWYKGYREEALLLIVKAAALSQDNGVLLNNCAAILNMSGLEDRAIPILNYVLQSYPNNGMLLNNIGQAFAGLGETDSAMVFLRRSIKADPKNAEASNTAGQIEAIKGNKEQAIEDFKRSIKSAYNKPAAVKMHRLKKDEKFAPLIRPKVKLPEYFNLFKYDLPEQCLTTSTAAKARAEHNAFRNMISKQQQRYGAQLPTLVVAMQKEQMQRARPLRKDEFMAQPYYDRCVTMEAEITDEYRAALKDLNSLTTKKYISDIQTVEAEYQLKLKGLKTGFEKREEGCGDGKANANCPTGEEKCRAFNELADKYLPQFAALTEDWQKKNILLFRKYFDELAYWRYLALHPIGDATFRMQYITLIEEYLNTMGSICITKIIDPCEIIPVEVTADSNAISEIDCPLDIEIGFAVGKLQLNCEKVSFSGGEGALFSYEKNFKTKQSTVSVGAGVKLDIGFKAGPVEAKAGVGLSETLFISFDGDNHIADAGMRVDASAGASAEAGGSQAVGQGVSVGGSRELAGDKIGVGVKFGINSGCNFNEGPFKGRL